MAKLGISLPDDLCKQLEDAATKKGKTVSGLIAEAVKAYLALDGGISQGAPKTNQGTPTPTPAPPQTDPNLLTKLDAVLASIDRLSSSSPQVLAKLDALLTAVEQIGSGSGNSQTDSGEARRVEAIKELLDGFVKNIWPWIMAIYDDHTYVSQQIFQTVMTGLASPPITRPIASSQQARSMMSLRPKIVAPTKTKKMKTKKKHRSKVF